LYVYNNEYNVTREITIHPSRDWGGEGALGCVLGYGALHRLPAPLSEPLAGPGETLFETENARFSNEENRPLSGVPDGQFFAPGAGAAVSGDFLVPATLAGPPQGGTPVRKKEKRHGHNPNKVLDDYFMEGEKKSRELDHAPSAKSTPPPPPPKAGGPPRIGGPPPGPPSRTETPKAESVADTQISVDGSID
jgi:hypothetical protein